MKKIALINMLFFNDSIKKDKVKDYLTMSNCFFRSAEKYFLKNHDVDYIVITNQEENIGLDYVKHIKTDYETKEFHHILLMKVLGLQFLQDEYDYIFVSDADQIIINEITDEDLLTHEYSFMSHYFGTTLKSIEKSMTTFVEVNCEPKDHWTMGNFYGGSSKNMYELFRQSKEIHENLYPHSIMQEHKFYCKYPDELFIAKYAYENDVDYKLLSSNLNFSNGENSFLSDFKDHEGHYPNVHNAKILHDTKKSFDVLNKIIKYYSNE